MGSRTKYYTDLQVQHMFEETDNLWSKEINRAASSAKSMSPKEVFPIMLTDSFFFYNETVFDKMGVNANVDMAIERLTKSGIGYYIATHVDSHIQEVIDWYFKGSDGTGIDTTILKTKDYLDDTYSSNNQCQIHCYQYINGHQFSEMYPAYYINGKRYIITYRTYNNKVVPDIIYGKLKMLPVDDNCNVLPEKDDEGHIVNPRIDVTIPTDERSVLAVEYKVDSGGYRFRFIFDSEVMRSTDHQTALVIPFYKDKHWVEPDKKVNYILTRFGLNAEDKDGDSLKKSMESAEDLKHAFIAYSMKRDNEKYGYWVDLIYGNEDSTGKDENEEPVTPPDEEENGTPPPPLRTIRITGDYDITYQVYATDSDTQEYKVSVERETKNADEDYYYIIPTSFMKKQKLLDKFEGYKYMFNMWMYAEKKVRIKWYQTLFFRIIFFFVAVFFMFSIGIISMTQALYAIAGQALSMLMSHLDPRLAAILGLAIALLSFNPGNVSSMLNVANSMISTYSSFVLEAMKGQIEAISEEIKSTVEDTKDMKEQLAEMWRQGMYIPLDTMDYMSEQMYNGGMGFVEMSYNQSDMLAIAQENLTNPYIKLF